MKKFFSNSVMALIAGAFIAAPMLFVFGQGCTTTTTNSGPSGTTTNTVVKGIDAATLAEIDASLAQAASNAPAIAASIIAVQNSIHGAPSVTVVTTNK